MSYTLKLENGRRVHVSDLSEEEINKTENRYNSMVCHVCHKDEEHSVPKHSLGGFILGAGIGTILGNSVFTKQYNKQKTKRTKSSSESSDKKTSTKKTPKSVVSSNKKTYLPNGLVKSIDTTSKKRITNKDIVDGVNLNEGIKVPANNKYKKVPKNLSDKKLTDQANYLPKRQIASVNTTYGKSFKREDIRDGAYIKKGVKFAEGGKTSHKEVFIEKDKNKYVLISVVNKNESNPGLRRWANEFFKSEDEAIKFALQNNLKIVEKYAEGGMIKISSTKDSSGEILKGNKVLANYTVSSSNKGSVYQVRHDGVGYSFSSKAQLQEWANENFSGDKYAKGGYLDKSEEEIWNNWSEEQRRHFLKDHQILRNVFQEIRVSRYRFDELPIDLINVIKSKLKEHISEGQYARGGGVGKTRKAPFKVGDMVYSYQNPNDKMRISFIEDRGVIDGVDYGWGIKVALKTDEYGNYNPKGTYSQSSKWMSANSVSKTKKEKYALGGGIDSDETPRIYVADLAAYNEGKLVGKWLDLTDYSDADDLMAAIQDLMSDFSEEQGVTREEWAIHDYENFPSSFYSEYMGRDEFEKIYQLMEAANDRDIPYEVLGEAMSMKGSDDPYEVADNYNGEYDSFKDFAYQLVDDIGISGVSNADFYFDYEGFGSDERINMGSEEEEESGYEDLSDEDLGYELVEQVGGLEGLSERTIEMYFDYDKFARDLEMDYDEIRMNGMSYIFFTSYKRGGVPGR